MTTARDTYNQIVYAKEQGLEEGRKEGREEGEKKGREEGLKEGIAKGEEKGKLEIARKMKDLGLAPDIISASTGLDEEAIKNLH